MAKENKLPTVDIKGKPYVLTQHRLLEFHRLYPNGSIQTDIVTDSNDSVVMVTKVYPNVKEPNRVFTGIASETQGSTFINKTSHYENCETSSRARALSNLGIGVEESCASAEEVANAVIQQSEQQIVEGMKNNILKLMSVFSQSEKWIPKAIELGVANADIMQVSLNYVLDSKTIKESTHKLNHTLKRFDDIFTDLNKKIAEERKKVDKK
tara:strand:+ start:162 stop:791 length:630 start_codon:yes stop_codon:yes gene_type:complete